MLEGPPQSRELFSQVGRMKTLDLFDYYDQWRGETQQTFTTNHLGEMDDLTLGEGHTRVADQVDPGDAPKLTLKVVKPVQK